MKDYCYLVTIDIPALVRTIKGPSKYSRELIEMFPCCEDQPYNDPKRYIMTKDQLAQFLYLRCRAGASNGIRELDMQRTQGKTRSEYDVDLRQQTPDPDQTVCVPGRTTLVDLAKQLTKVHELLSKLADGMPMNYDGLPLNTEHMTQVLQAQRTHLRAKIIAASATGE